MKFKVRINTNVIQNARDEYITKENKSPEYIILHPKDVVVLIKNCTSGDIEIPKSVDFNPTHIMDMIIISSETVAKNDFILAR